MYLKDYYFTNGSMTLMLVAMYNDVALLKRVSNDDYVVVNGFGFRPDDMECEWNFAYGYINDFEQAMTLFKSKI